MLLKKVITILILIPFLWGGGFVHANIIGGEVYETAMTAEPHSLDPKDVRNFFTAHVASQIFEGLVKLDEELNIVPGIAENWEILDSGKMVRFKLKRGVYFHDGQKVTAYDAASSLERLIRLQEENLFLYALENIVGAKEHRKALSPHVVGIVPINDRELTLRLIIPNPNFYKVLATINCAILPKKMLADPSAKIKMFPIGTGPFKIVSWEKGKKIVLGRHDLYHDGLPKIKTLVFHILPEEELIKAFEEGKIMDTFGLSIYLNINVHSDKHYKVHAKLPILYFLAMNARKYPFNKPSFRRAIVLGFNKQRVLEEVFGGELEASSNIPYGVGGYSLNRDPNLEFNPEKAKELLKSVGIKPGKIMIWGRTSMPNRNRFKSILEQVYKDIGLDVEVRFLSSEEFMRKFYKREMGMFYAGHNINMNDADFVFGWYESQTRLNFTAMANREFDLLMRIAREEPDDYVRYRLYARADRILSKEAVQIPLFNKVFRGYVSNKVKNFNIVGIGPTVKYKDVEVLP